MNPMNDPIYKAIATLCDFKGKASYAEIASVAGVKKQVAVDVLLRNKHLLKLDKNGNVLGFISIEENARRLTHIEFTQGKVFKVDAIPYGYGETYLVVEQMYADKVKHLLEVHPEFKTECIFANETNKQALNDLGFREWDVVVNGKILAAHGIWHDWQFKV